MVDVGMTDGWHYEQPWAGGAIKLEASGAKELLQAVIDFRVNQKLSVAAVEEEVAAYIKVHSPANDRWRFAAAGGSLLAVVTPAKAHPKNLLERLQAWFKRITSPGEDIKLLLKTEAQQRLDTCAQCPHNVNWLSGCSPCNDDLERESLLLRRGVNLDKPKVLLRKKDWRHSACRLHGVELLSACCLPLDRLGVSRLPEAPAVCWMPIVS